MMRNMAACPGALQGIQWQSKPALSMKPSVKIVITEDHYLPIRQRFEETVLIRGQRARMEKATPGVI